MSIGSVFVFSESLRQGALRISDSRDGAATTAATVMVGRLMRGGRYAEAAHVAVLGRRWSSASHALRIAVARGDMSFTALFTSELQAASYRDALTDPLLAVAVGLSGHDRMLDSAREGLLACAITDAATLGEKDEREWGAADRTEIGAAAERVLWAAVIELMGLRALGDWGQLASALERATGAIAATPRTSLARVGSLRSFLSAQIELCLALLGEPEFVTVDKHLRDADALAAQDRRWVRGCVALAATLRGELVAAKVILDDIDPLSSAGVSAGPHDVERTLASVLVALEERDADQLDTRLGEIAERGVKEAGLADLVLFAHARCAYLRGQSARAFQYLRSLTAPNTVPWVYTEAAAFRVERHLAEGFTAQAATVLDEIQRTPYARWPVSRLALAKVRFSEDQVEPALRIAESVWASEGAAARHHARALAIGSACARQLGDHVREEVLSADMRFFSRRGGLSEPYDDLPGDSASAGSVRRLRPILPMPARRVELTKRESTVLQSLRDRASADEISASLHVSKNTVKTQLRHIYRKLGVHSREEALRVAVDEGLI